MTQRPSQSFQKYLAEMICPVQSRIDSVDWFSRIGQPESVREVNYAIQYLDRLGIQYQEIMFISSSAEAVDHLKFQFDADWSVIEDEYRSDFIQSIESKNMMEYVESYLKQLLDQNTDRVMEFAENRLAGYNRYLPKVGAGSVMEVIYQYALEKAVNDPRFAGFEKKFRLFQCGRWPLCMYKCKYLIY